MSDSENHKMATNQFIDLANVLKNQGLDPALISGAMMTASSIYATYVAAGNEGALEPSGVDKVVNLYRRTLEHFQDVKRAGLERDASAANESTNKPEV